jgi:hypothetical protein
MTGELQGRLNLAKSKALSTNQPERKGLDLWLKQYSASPAGVKQ